MPNYREVGTIQGSPLCGLCERVCIEVRTVYDGCTRRENNLTAIVTFTGFTAGPPADFVSIESNTATIEDLTVVPFPTGNRATVSYILNIPLTLYYLNNSGGAGTATGTLRLNRTTVLRLPDRPYTIEPTVALQSRVGSFLTADMVSFHYCIIETVKVIVMQDLIIPTYGPAIYPTCTGDAVCPGFDDD